MTRSLVGKKFYTSFNNGVEAIVAEDVFLGMVQVEAITAILEKNECDRGGLICPYPVTEAIEKGLKHFAQTPIFTFADADRVASSPWITGNRRLLRVLLEYIQEEGGAYREGMVYVPFSNAAEIGAHGVAAQAKELAYTTTDQQFRDTFGIGPRELDVWYAERVGNNS